MELPKVSRCDYEESRRSSRIKSITAYDEDGNKLLTLAGPFHSRYDALTKLRDRVGPKRKSPRVDHIKLSRRRARRKKEEVESEDNANRERVNALMVVLAKRRKKQRRAKG